MFITVYLLSSQMKLIIIKRLHRSCVSTTVGTVSSAVTGPHTGYAVSIRVESNLKLCVFYLKHQARVTRVPTAGGINLGMVRNFKDHQKCELGYNKTAVEPLINYKDWP
jgi:hypothetical protein